MIPTDSISARYYSSQLGRFLTPDWSSSPEPIPYASLSNPQSVNLYSYVLNNPAMDTDPDGHLSVLGHSFLGSFGGSCTQAPKLPVKEGAAGAAAADGTLSNLDTQAILDGLRSDADAVISGAADFAGIATGTFGAVLPFSKPLNPGEDQIMARVRAKQVAKDASGAQDKKLSTDEIEQLEEAGHDVFEIKGRFGGGKVDPYKDSQRNIYAKPKGSSAKGEPIGLNIDNLH